MNSFFSFITTLLLQKPLTATLLCDLSTFTRWFFFLHKTETFKFLQFNEYVLKNNQGVLYMCGLRKDCRTVFPFYKKQ